MLSKQLIYMTFAGLCLSGCQTMETSLGGSEVSMFTPFPDKFLDIEGDKCYAKDTTPALIETVTEQVLVSTAVLNPDGTILRPAVYRTETKQQILQTRQELRFETPCPQLLTPQLTATLQRALKARGYYPGPISAQMDLNTKNAIRKFQSFNGINSSYLTMDTARTLGVIAYERDAL